MTGTIRFCLSRPNPLEVIGSFHLPFNRNGHAYIGFFRRNSFPFRLIGWLDIQFFFFYVSIAYIDSKNSCYFLTIVLEVRCFFPSHIKDSNDSINNFSASILSPLYNNTLPNLAIFIGSPFLTDKIFTTFSTISIQ